MKNITNENNEEFEDIIDFEIDNTGYEHLLLDYITPTYDYDFDYEIIRKSDY